MREREEEVLVRGMRGRWGFPCLKRCSELLASWERGLKIVWWLSVDFWV